MKIVYSKEYDLSFFGLEELHAFDSKKYSATWNELTRKVDHSILLGNLKEVKSECNKATISRVHTKEYLIKLKNSTNVLDILETPFHLIGNIIPEFIIDKFILRPMKFAVQGTIIAAQEALKNGAAINISGGYHHASEDHGEGFCIYSDIAIAIKELRETNLLKNDDHIIIIDLDAHQGNGLERIFMHDGSIKIMDMYNKDIYPMDHFAKQRINCHIPLPKYTKDSEYLSVLKEELPMFISGVSGIKLAFFNAGTDVYEQDPLGKLSLTEQGIKERDVFVMETLTNNNIPWVMLPSGGYTKKSYQLMANSFYYAIEKWCN